MIKANALPYGALCTFQPEYLGDIVHDELNHPDQHGEIETPLSSFWFSVFDELRLIANKF